MCVTYEEILFGNPSTHWYVWDNIKNFNTKMLVLFLYNKCTHAIESGVPLLVKRLMAKRHEVE